MPLYEEIKRMPFLRELADGTLPREKFNFYIGQDKLYLDNYTRVLAHIASRLPDMTDVTTFLNFALAGVATERALHDTFNTGPRAAMSAACEYYTSYLKGQSQEDVAVEAASVLPCFWVYLEVGKYLLSIATLDGNPYRAWLETYSDPAFDESTAKAIAVCDRLAEMSTEHVRREMTKVFVGATRLEWLFWESAYRLGDDTCIRR